MHRLPRLLILASATALAATGCATTSETSDEKKNEQRLVQEAPLGSRIRKKSNVAPVLGATREDIEQARVQQGAILTGAAQKTSTRVQSP